MSVVYITILALRPSYILINKEKCDLAKYQRNNTILCVINKLIDFIYFVNIYKFIFQKCKLSRHYITDFELTLTICDEQTVLKSLIIMGS